MKEKKIAIIQSNYIPWKGYFDIINMVDEFIFYDDVQFTKRDWRNRNLIKTSNGLLWLTIPVLLKNKFQQTIKETKINGSSWKQKHLKSILLNYKKAEGYIEVKDFIIDLYNNINSEFVCEVNYFFIKKICEFLGINTIFKYSFDFNLAKGRSERVVDLCLQVGATHLINGPSARNHMEEGLFHQAGIKVNYMDYDGYPQYPQLFPPFEHKISILDLMLNAGKKATEYMKSFKHNSTIG